MDKAVLTGQGERSDAAPATATGATAAAEHPVASTADLAAPEAAADSPAVADATAVPDAGSGAVPAAPATVPPATVAPAAGTAQLPARARAPRWANLPYALVLAAVAGGLAWVALGGLRHVQAGMMTVASALLVAAVLRLALPERAAGLLVSRRRVLDAAALASLGAGIMVAVLVLPAP